MGQPQSALEGVEVIPYERLFGGLYQGRRVFVTGHTGFKGSWLMYWLESLGAQTSGYSLEPPTQPNHYGLLDWSRNSASTIGDIRDTDRLRAALEASQCEILFHMAAQPLVRKSYAEPLETWDVNVMGTARLLELCRNLPGLKAVVVISSDKCYLNREWVYGYREVDHLGGHDPYSASKAATEIVVSSYRDSFFNTKSQVLLASVRAGNVVGGGDWATDRLTPDLVRSADGQAINIRSPDAVRPWQHVLNPLSGYLLLGQRLLQGDSSCADAWNFGPNPEGIIPVRQFVDRFARAWSDVRYTYGARDPNQPHEAGLLALDIAKAQHRLGWRPVWEIEHTIQRTADWYRAFHADSTVLTKQDLDAFVGDATAAGAPWAV